MIRMAIVVNAVSTSKWSDKAKPKSDHIVWYNGIIGRYVQDTSVKTGVAEDCMAARSADATPY